MAPTTPWFRWLQRTTHYASMRSIADQAHVSPSTVSRWFAKPTFAAARTIATAYGGDLLEGLVAAELLTTEDLEQLSFRTAVGESSGAVLVDEIGRRLRAAEAKRPRGAKH